MQLDSLNQVAARLQAENSDLNSNLSQERTKNNNLSAQNSVLNSKVAAGSILKALTPSVEGVRYKSSGKEVITDRAKQIQKLRTRFTLVENKVIDKGPVDLFIRVIGPDGTVMASVQDPLKGNGAPIAYTLKETVDYANQDTPVEVNWSKGSEFLPGNYSIEIYHSGAMIGKSSILLK
jgi:hypothetical protein